MPPPASYRGRRAVSLRLNNWNWRGEPFIRPDNWHRSAVRISNAKRRLFDGFALLLGVVGDGADDRLTTVTNGNILDGDVFFVASLQRLRQSHKRAYQLSNGIYAEIFFLKNSLPTAVVL